MPAVIRRTWAENYSAHRGPPLDSLLPPADITVFDVVHGPYGVNFCKKHLEEGWLEEIVVDRDSFVKRRVYLNDEQKNSLNSIVKSGIQRI